MRMTENQLVIQSLDDIKDTEGAELFFNLGVKHNLQQQIAKLLLHVIRIILIKGLQHFVGFLNQILAQRFMRLLTVPRAALRASQGVHNLMKPRKGTSARILCTVRRDIDQGEIAVAVNPVQLIERHTHNLLLLLHPKGMADYHFVLRRIQLHQAQLGLRSSKGIIDLPDQRMELRLEL
ncbi:hypothetical protein D3C80_1346300 [compost metagenome]